MSAAFRDSAYDDSGEIANTVAGGRHREVVGGLWEQIGNLQFEFLASHGLEPTHHLLDIGCGCLRGGVRFAAYLEPSHYWGIDSNQSLLDAGHAIELAQAGLSDRVPRENLLYDDEFRFARFGRMFDVAIAQSLFTHLSANRIKLCLNRLATVMKPGGRLFATYFEVTEHHPFGEACDHPHGVRTWSFKDPFHYPVSAFERLLDGEPWRLIWTGEWDHPRDQRMAILERLSEPSGVSPDAVTRALTPEQARALGAGDGHYRAYVGPPDRFDFMSASQFALLFSLGLRDHHAVLDFGCGSLRLGRLLMPYLQAGRYFGIDPNRWLIHDALSRETGWSIVAVKKPTFAYNDDFRCDVFSRRFDFVVAQSIITHCGRSLAKLLLHQFARTLTPDGIALFSIIEAAPPEEETAAEGWVYPGCVPYRQATIAAWCAEAGMAVVRLPWFHPGAVWYGSALSPARLPAPSHITALSGAVLFDPQFRASWPS
jgi:cyclopropane fatty-acyl-phospholipid synthase-like methyltransferase